METWKPSCESRLRVRRVTRATEAMRLSAEAERMNVENILFCSDLAGRVRLETEQGVVGIHAIAIVGD